MLYSPAGADCPNSQPIPKLILNWWRSGTRCQLNSIELRIGPARGMSMPTRKLGASFRPEHGVLIDIELRQHDLHMKWHLPFRKADFPL